MRGEEREEPTADVRKGRRERTRTARLFKDGAHTRPQCTRYTNGPTCCTVARCRRANAIRQNEKIGERKLIAFSKPAKRHWGHQSSLSTPIHSNRFCFRGGHVRSAVSNRASNCMHQHKHCAMGRAFFLFLLAAIPVSSDFKWTRGLC